jgi:hypothetical protein
VKNNLLLACAIVSQSQLQDPTGKITEASGIDVSHETPGLYWTHNDSGGTPTLYGITEKGEIKREVRVSGARAVDWEDLASGECYRGKCLFILDAGNNDRTRDKFEVYVVDESNFKADTFSFRYPEGKRANAEALAYNEQDKALYLIDKTPGTATLFRFPALAKEMTLEPLCTFQGIPAVTGADISVDGSRLLVRTVADVRQYLMLEKDTCRNKPSWILPGYGEPQGEAVAFTKTGFVSISEGYQPKINMFSCEEKCRETDVDPRVRDCCEPR